MEKGKMNSQSSHSWSGREPATFCAGEGPWRGGPGQRGPGAELEEVVTQRKMLSWA